MKRRSALPGVIFLSFFMLVGISMLIGAVKFAFTPGGETAAMILGGMGIVYILFTSLIMAVLLKDDVKRKRLLAKGKVLPAKIEYIEQVRSRRSNKSSGSYSEYVKISYLIICSYEDVASGMQYRFKSELLSMDPSRVLSQGSPIDVYVDEKDYSKHYVAVQEELQKRNIVDFT